MASGLKILIFSPACSGSCGVPGLSNTFGLSDAFGVALWARCFTSDGICNFSGTMFHVGGQNVYYNMCIPLSWRLH